LGGLGRRVSHVTGEETPVREAEAAGRDTRYRWRKTSKKWDGERDQVSSKEEG